MTNYITPFIYIKEVDKQTLNRDSLNEIITNTYDFDVILLATDFDIRNFLELIDPEFVTRIKYYRILGGLDIEIFIPESNIADMWTFEFEDDGSLFIKELKEETLIAMRKSLSQKNKANKI